MLESRGPHSEETQGPDATLSEAGKQGPLSEATCSLDRSQAVEAESRSNLAVRKRNLTTEDLLFIWENRPDEVKYLSGAQKRKLRKQLAIIAGERVIPRCERRKRWYQVDGSLSEYVQSKKDADKLRSETAQQGSMEFGKIIRWVKSEEPLPDMANAMEVAVVLEGFPCTKMTKLQGEEIEAELNHRIKPNGKEPVQFVSTQFKWGAMIFTCANKGTKMWLRNTIPKLNLWPRAKLEVGPADILAHGIKLIVWLKHLMKRRTTEQILDLMEKQNKGISTSEWSVIERNDFEHNASLTLWVDNRSMNKLKERGLKLHLGLGRVTFKPLLLLDKNKIDTGSSVSNEHQSAGGPSVKDGEKKVITQNSSQQPETQHCSQKVECQNSYQETETNHTQKTVVDIKPYHTKREHHGKEFVDQKPAHPIMARNPSKFVVGMHDTQNSQKPSIPNLAVVKPMYITSSSTTASDKPGHQEPEVIILDPPDELNNYTVAGTSESREFKSVLKIDEVQFVTPSAQQYTKPRYSTLKVSQPQKQGFPNSQNQLRDKRPVDSCSPPRDKSTYITSSTQGFNRPRYITVCPPRPHETALTNVDSHQANKPKSADSGLQKSHEKRLSDTDPEKRSKSWSSTQSREGQFVNFAPPNIGEKRFSDAQLPEKKSTPWSSTQSREGQFLDFATPKFGEKRFSDTALAQLTDKKSKPWSSTQSRERQFVDFSPRKFGEKRFSDTALAQSAEKRSKPWSSAQSREGQFLDFVPTKFGEKKFLSPSAPHFGDKDERSHPLHSLEPMSAHFGDKDERSRPLCPPEPGRAHFLDKDERSHSLDSPEPMCIYTPPSWSHDIDTGTSHNLWSRRNETSVGSSDDNQLVSYPVFPRGPRFVNPKAPYSHNPPYHGLYSSPSSGPWFGSSARLPPEQHKGLPRLSEQRQANKSEFWR